MTAFIHPCCGQAPDIAVLIKGLWIVEIGVWNRNRCGTPVRGDEPSQSIRVIPCAEIVETGLCVPFFAGELVIVRVVVDELQLATPWVIVGFGFDGARGIGND